MSLNVPCEKCPDISDVTRWFETILLMCAGTPDDKRKLYDNLKRFLYDIFIFKKKYN